jgi:hypothetical protein
MDILHLETEASKLRIKLLKTIPARNKLFFLYSFFRILLEEKNRNIAESYILEFGKTYFDLISKIDLAGIHPKVVEVIIEQSKQLLAAYPEDDSPYPASCISSLEEKNKKLSAFLEGGVSVGTAVVSLPLLQKESEKFEDDYGVLSTLSVQVKPVSGENKFHIIPGRGDPDAELKQQAENSLVNALRIAGRHAKIKHSSWDVYIDFENKTGEYSGSSFGALLVLKLVEEILRYYDSPTKIFSNVPAAITGAVDKQGNIPSLTPDIVAVKTKIIFFSDVKQFIIPEDDFIHARDTLEQLHKEFPDRNLKLVGIQTVDDLFDLRNVVDIKKESTLLRTGKFIKRQALALFLLIPLTAIVIFSGVFDFDNNPDHFEYKGKVGFIMNKSGKELYQTRLEIDFNNETYAGTILNSGRIYDTDNDGVNEILLSNGIQTLEEPNSNALRIICYDKELNTRWQYSFKKVVSTSYEKHTDIYNLELEDSLTIDGELNIFCIARNSLAEVSALFRLNSRTGKQKNDILWHSGHLNTVHIFRYDNENELYATAINNGLERSVLFCLSPDKLDGQLPAAEGYELLNIGQADPDQYLLLPKTDYTDYYQQRYNIPIKNALYFDKARNEILIYLYEGDPSAADVGLGYRFTKDLKFVSVSLGDALIEKRDELVKAGKIKGPLTRTKEFEQSLVSQLRYWDGKKFVSAAERFK